MNDIFDDFYAKYLVISFNLLNLNLIMSIYCQILGNFKN